MKIANYAISSIETGRFALDGGAMFGVVPKVLWEKKNPADEYNRISLAMRVLLLRDDKRNILVDTGIGHKFSPKKESIFGVDHSHSTLEKSLKEQGLTPEDITDVILTHLHFDHAGGATCLQDDKVVPTFSNAQYYVQKKNWDWANHPTEKDKASYITDNFIPLMEHGQLKLLEDEQEILPGIYPWLSNGHTIGQQLIRISDAENTLIYCADIIPTSTHIAIPYVMGYDLHPLTTIEEKKEILNQAVTNGWYIFFEHDPHVSACTVKQGQKKIEMEQTIII